MTGAVGRFLGLWAVLAGVELLERTAFRAGVVDEHERHRRARGLSVVAVDDLEAVDLTDVLVAHGVDVEDLADAEDDAEWARGHEQ